MSGTPIGDAAREATAPPWHGRHRAPLPPPRDGISESKFGAGTAWGRKLDSAADPEPDRCPSCGHPYDAECGCTCCLDTPDDPEFGAARWARDEYDWYRNGGR